MNCTAWLGVSSCTARMRMMFSNAAWDRFRLHLTQHLFQQDTKIFAQGVADWIAERILFRAEKPHRLFGWHSSAHANQRSSIASSDPQDRAAGN